MTLSTRLLKAALMIGGLICITLLVFLSLPFLKADDESEDEAGNKGPKGPAVYAQVVQPEQLREELNVSGTVIPANEVQLTVETAGKITALPLDEGKRVSKGELLVKINDAELQANLKSAKHQKELLALEKERKAQLLESEGISQSEYDRVKTELERVKADIERLQAQIEKTEIRAPFDGVVGLKNVSEGSYVSPSSHVATLRQVQPVKIDFSIPAEYADAVAEGQTIRFRANGLDSMVQADIYAIEPAIATSTRTLHIRALYENRNRKVIPGNFAEIELTLSTQDDALMVPTESVIAELEGKKLFLYKNGQSVPQPIQTGHRQSERLQVTKGLSAGDTVITRGTQKVKPNGPVRIKKIQKQNKVQASM